MAGIPFSVTRGAHAIVPIPKSMGLTEASFPCSYYLQRLNLHGMDASILGQQLCRIIYDDPREQAAFNASALQQAFYGGKAGKPIKKSGVEPNNP